jgi:nucleolin
VSALPRFQLRLYSTTEESDRTHEAASELTTETETETSELTSEGGASSDATAAGETTAPARPGDQESAARSIYMGNIYFDITEDQIKELAVQYGAVEKVRLMKDVRGFSRG